MRINGERRFNTQLPKNNVRCFSTNPRQLSELLHTLRELAIKVVSHDLRKRYDIFRLRFIIVDRPDDGLHIRHLSPS
jgi:hypothetical protein